MNLEEYQRQCNFFGKRISRTIQDAYNCLPEDIKHNLIVLNQRETELNITLFESPPKEMKKRSQIFNATLKNIGEIEQTFYRSLVDIIQSKEPTA